MNSLLFAKFTNLSSSKIFPRAVYWCYSYSCVIYSVVLSVIVYSGSAIVNGDEIAALINQNKETFSLAVSDAVVGKSPV